MARGGYFEGNDYVPYKSCPLSKSSSTSRKEISSKTLLNVNIVVGLYIKKILCIL